MTRVIAGLVGAVLVGALLVLAPDAAATAAGGPPAGMTTAGRVTSNGSEFPYLLHTPASYQEGAPVPLVVVVHGCQTTARQEMELTRFNDLAEREGFVVLYPEVDAIGQQLPGPLAHCWRFYDPTAYFRGNNDPAAIAAMARAVMSERSIDEERVYLVGVSAGGLMTSASAAAYPDLYAAVGLVVTAGYADAPCFTTGIGIPVEVSALLAFQQMGPRARVVPAISIGGGADAAFPTTCTRKALEQSLRTNNLVLGGAQDGPLPLAPATVREAQVPEGRAYTVRTFLDPDGCLVGESWVIHGMPHAWPGGADYGGYTDTLAPDGAEAIWAFLERYRRSATSMPCAEAVAPDQGSAPVTAEAPHGPSLPATGGGDPQLVPLVLAWAALALGGVLRASRR